MFNFSLRKRCKNEEAVINDPASFLLVLKGRLILLELGKGFEGVDCLCSCNKIRTSLVGFILDKIGILSYCFGGILEKEGNAMWSRIKPKKMYLNIFLYSCIAVSMLTLVFTMFLSQQFARNAIDEIDKSNQEKMKQVVNTSEFTLQKLRQFALKVYSDESIAHWMNMEKNDYSPLSLNKAATSVREFMSSEPFIHGIYLINFNIDQIYTSESSIYTTQDFYDQSMLSFIKGQKTPYLQYVNHEVEGETYLALVVPAAGPNQNYQGFVAILFSKPMLNVNMLQISEEDQNKIYIEGKNKEFILGNTEPALAKALMEMDKSAAVQNWKWKSGNETWSIHTERLPIEGWNVYHLSPISLWQAKVTKIRIQIIGSSIFLLLALLLFLFWQSYRSLKPLSDLAHQIKSKLGKEHPIMQTMNANNEMAWIHSGFHSLVEKIEQLDLSIKSSKALVKDDFLRQWILNSKSSRPIEEFIRIQTQILSTGWFRMAIIRLESYGRFEEHYDFASRKLLRFAIGKHYGRSPSESRVCSGNGRFRLRSHRGAHFLACFRGRHGTSNRSDGGRTGSDTAMA